MKLKNRIFAGVLAVLAVLCCVSCGEKVPQLENVYSAESQVYVAVEEVKGKKIIAMTGKYIEKQQDEEESIRTFYDNGKKVAFSVHDEVFLSFEEPNTKAQIEDIKPMEVLLVELDNGKIFLVSILSGVTVKHTDGSGTDYLEDGFEEDASSYPDDSGKIGNSANTFKDDTVIDNKVFSTADKDSNAIRFESAEVTASNIRVQKQKGDSTNSSDSRLYGLNSAVLVRNAAKLLFKDSEVFTDALGANGIFVYSKSTTAVCDSAVFTAKGKQSYAAAAAGGAILHLKNSAIQAQGGGSAAVYVGVGGKVKIEDSSVKADAITSPALIAAGVVKAENSSFSSRSTEALVIASGADVALDNCSVSGTKDDFEDITNRDLYSIYLYGQKNAPAVFTMNGGSIADSHSTVFRVSGTDAQIYLKETQIGAYGGSLIKVTDSGSVQFTADNLLITPKFDIESGSSISVIVKNGTDMSAALGDAEGSVKASLSVEEGCRFRLTADTYLESFTGDYANIEFGRYKLFVAGEQVVKNGK